MVNKSQSAKPKTSMKPLWDEASPEERRVMIVDVAIKILDEQGVDRVTIRRVASEIGVGAMTLYTYIDGQQGLRTAMIDRGFDLMDEYCDKKKKNKVRHIATYEDWLKGCQAYVEFAVNNPSLYTLMFTHKVDDTELEAIHNHFETWRADLETQYRAEGVPEDKLELYVDYTSKNCWVAIHGLASLVISQRLPLDIDGIKKHIAVLMDRLYASTEELLKN